MLVTSNVHINATLGIAHLAIEQQVHALNVSRLPTPITQSAPRRRLHARGTRNEGGSAIFMTIRSEC